MTAAFFPEWLQWCEAGCAARAAQGCPSQPGPCTLGGCVLRQGLCRLPGSALSLPGELPMTLWGEGMGRRSDPCQGRVLLLLRGCCMGQGCLQLQITPRHWQSQRFKRKVKAGATLKIKTFPGSVISPFF